MTVANRPNNDDVGTYNIVIAVRDGNGADAGLDLQSFTIDVTNTNDRPEFISNQPNVDVQQDALFTYAIEATDVDVGDMARLVLTLDAPAILGSVLSMQATDRALYPVIHRMLRWDVIPFGCLQTTPQVPTTRGLFKHLR